MAYDGSTSRALNLVIGQYSIAGIKTINEDAAGAHQPEHEHALVNKGVALAIADGVSSAEAGKQASEYAVSKFIEEYFTTPDTWSVKQAGQKTLSSINLNLFKKSHEFSSQEKGFLCTFIGVIVKSCTAYFFHAGDSRLYHICKDDKGKKVMKKITRDHTVNIGGGKNILSRAVGMDNVLQIDFGKLVLNESDQLLLTTDGVHDFLSEDEILQVISGTQPCEASQQQDAESNSAQSLDTICQRLGDLAANKGSDDNISCVLANIVSLPHESRDDFNSKLTRLPFPPDLAPGMKVDGYEIIEELFASTRSQVYLVKDSESDNTLIMKTPSINYQDDVHYIDRFIQEEWIGKRIKSPHTVKIITQNRERTFLYYLMERVPGISLDKWMLQNPLPSPKNAIDIVKQIAKALSALHEAETIHQDLKPANIMIDDKRHVKVIDFGSVFVAGIAEIFTPIEHTGALGTATYSDPYYLHGRNTGVQGDIYALATISYELFTGQLPYGEKIEKCEAMDDFDKLRYIPASNYNPVVPLWFDRALEKGVSLKLDNRYHLLDDFVRDLTHPNPKFLKDDPVIESNKGLMFWQMMSAFWILMLIIVVVLFSANT
ncbi:protein kinase domain-containing protein [Ningiella sp. W23]|uniref:protein kinase domain-containing protein n=1 Tax=Ningiella sp. W23 TaxID=3023715 RepID=UPI003757A58E